jgi:hypothetical protein
MNTQVLNFREPNGKLLAYIEVGIIITIDGRTASGNGNPVIGG